MENITLISISSIVAIVSVIVTFFGLYQSRRTLKETAIALQQVEAQLLEMRKEEIEKMLAAIERGEELNITFPKLSSESITKAAETPTKPYKYTDIQFGRGFLKEA